MCGTGRLNRLTIVACPFKFSFTLKKIMHYRIFEIIGQQPGTKFKRRKS
jgi:hypothetical protein